MAITASLIKQVLEEQQKVRLPQEFVKRDVYAKLKRQASLPEISVITGLRRVGKSTLLQQLRSEAKESSYYINFDDDRLVHFALEDFQILLEAFIELFGVQKSFYFDEIQNIPGWELFVRRLHDQGNKIFVTGSNASLFSQELGTRLTGRYLQVELFPYSYSELFWHHHQRMKGKLPCTTEEKGIAAHAFNSYRKEGGIPPFVQSKEPETVQTLYESVLYRDIVARYKLTSDRPIKELVYYLASNVGKEFSYSGLAKMIGIGSATTIADYLHYLSLSYLSFTVSRFSHSLAKQSLYNKKCYFIDHGMARLLGFRSSEDAGRLLENLVFIELKRRGGELYFHKEEKECDFLVRKSGKVSEAIQVCTSLHNPETRKREIDGLIEAMQAHNLSKGLILTESEEEPLSLELNGRRCEVSLLPIWKWALLSTDPSGV